MTAPAHLSWRLNRSKSRRWPRFRSRTPPPLPPQLLPPPPPPRRRRARRALRRLRLRPAGRGLTRCAPGRTCPSLGSVLRRAPRTLNPLRWRWLAQVCRDYGFLPIPPALVFSIFNACPTPPSAARCLVALSAASYAFCSPFRSPFWSRSRRHRRRSGDALGPHAQVRPHDRKTTPPSRCKLRTARAVHNRCPACWVRRRGRRCVEWRWTPTA